MSNYTVTQRAQGLWSIVDARGDCMYLIEGDDSALLIDTGMSDEPLMPLIRTYTQKPVALALTHAHIDHMYRFAEFDTVYLHENDKAAYRSKTQHMMNFGALLFRVKRKKYPVASFKSFKAGDILPLGGLDIHCFDLAGHTKGSAVFVDNRHQAVFCGDAVGSGSGVWMFLPDCTNLSQYRSQLYAAQQSLLPYRDYSYFGGHKDENGFPLAYQTIVDMHTLCNDLLHGTATPIPVKKIPFLRLLYAKHAHAALVTRKGKIN